MDFDSRYRGEMIKYVSQRYGADHVAQIVTFSTIKARAAVRDAARVLDYPYGLGDKIAQAHAAADHGSRHAAERLLREAPEVRGRLQDGRGPPGVLRVGSRRQARHRRRQGARRAAPPGRHPRRRGRDHEGATHRVPPGAAQAGAGRDHRGRAGRHAVRDARRRGPRSAQDGLPRPAQPRRHRDHARAGGAVHRDPARHRQRPARRPEDLRPPARR